MTSALKGSLFFWFTVFGAILVGAALISPKIMPRPYAGVPLPVQREQQRKIIRERVEAAGGWDALRIQCESLFTNGLHDFYWQPPHHAIVAPPSSHASFARRETSIAYSPLPPALASLQPHKVRTYALPDQPPMTSIELFGGHSTGARGIPYYTLEIVCGPAPEGYTPSIVFGGAEITKIAESVFEVY